MKIANTIGKKLYLGFGAVLGILLILSAVSLSAILRERQEQSDASPRRWPMCRSSSLCATRSCRTAWPSLITS